MALQQVIELTKRVQDYAKKAKYVGDPDIYGGLSSNLVKTIKARLVDGIEKGINIEGGRFKKADPSPTNLVTKKLREYNNIRPMLNPRFSHSLNGTRGIAGNISHQRVELGHYQR